MKAVGRIKIVLEAVVAIFYPSHCVVCKRELRFGEEHICLACLYDLPYLTPTEDTAHPSLDRLFIGRVKVEAVHALLHYQKGNQAQHLIHSIKYHQKTRLATFLGGLLAETIKAQQFDGIIPVPLHPKKLNKRGFNQSYYIAKGIQTVIDAPIQSNCLKRVQYNPSQTTVTKLERWGNVRDSFAAPRLSLLQNKHVLLVDDVLTTGATTEACVRQLKRARNCRVTVAAVATGV